MRAWRLIPFIQLAAAAVVPGPAGSAPPAPPRPAPAALIAPNGVALDAQGNLYISDIAAHRVFRVDRNGGLTVAAGTGEPGYGGDGGPAIRARLHAPHDLAFDAEGNLLVADSWNHRIRRIDGRGVISTTAGTGRPGYAGDGGPATRAALDNPQGIAVAPDGALFIADTFNHVVRRVDATGVIRTFAGTEAGLAGDGGPALRAQVSLPVAAVPGPDGVVFIADAGNNRIRRVDAAGIIETLLGEGPGSGTAGAGFGGDGGPARKARVFGPMDVAPGPSGELFLTDSGNHRIRRVSQGMIVTVAGTGAAGFGGDGGPAFAALLNSPQKLVLAPDGGLYAADRANGRVRRIDPRGRIETAAAPGPAAAAGAR